MIYTFVEEVQKLKLVRYNKNMQKNLDISIINYKFFSGRYIIYESNKIGKEYNGEDDTLIFEGEYLNGKSHGKGKEYDKFGKLEFEGEYLEGKEMVKEKYILILVIYNLELNIWMIKNGLELDMIIITKYYIIWIMI